MLHFELIDPINLFRPTDILVRLFGEIKEVSQVAFMDGCFIRVFVQALGCELVNCNQHIEARLAIAITG